MDIGKGKALQTKSLYLDKSWKKEQSIELKFITCLLVYVSINQKELYIAVKEFKILDKLITQKNQKRKRNLFPKK